MREEWYDGPPPHIGWWNASTKGDRRMWRWWDGRCWSFVAQEWLDGESAAFNAARPTDRLIQPNVRWTHRWPEGARVPRVDPRHG